MDLVTIGFRADTGGIRTAGNELDNLAKKGGSADSAMGSLRRSIGLLGGALSIAQIVNYTNQWTDLNSRLINATKSADAADKAMSAIAATARRTYSSLQQTAESFLANAQTLTELGYSTERQLELSEALNNALVISGTKGQAAASVMDALSKSFAFGELRGENFNSVIQRGGRIVEALAEGLGVSTLELRRMAEQGELKTTKVIEALTSQLEKLREEADAMPATIGDAFTLLGNSLQQVVGRMNDVSGAGSSIADVIISIADAIDDLSASIASGQLEKEIQAIAIQFRSIGETFAQTMDYISMLSQQTGIEFEADWASALRNIPINIKTMVQIFTIELAHLVDQGMLIGQTWIDVWGAAFTTIGELAKLAGRAILAGLNPFESGPSAEEWARALVDPLASVFQEYQEQSEIFSSARRDSIMAAVEENDSVKASSEALRKEGQKLREEWEKQQKALSGASGAARDYANGVAEVSKGAQKIIKSLEDQYNKLVLTERQYLALQLAQEGANSAQIVAAMEWLDMLEEVRQSAQDTAIASPFDAWGDGIAAVISGVSQMQGALQQGSKEAKALGVVLQALAVAQGISAVLNQAQGDPYTAFARMAAMAAAIASLGVQIGGMSGGGTNNTAANRQATQGTGTVFGDTAAQSESILKSSDITARATTELVGINRGMLQAMQNLQAGITGAVGGIIRGGINMDVKTGTTNLLGDTLFTELEGLWGKDGLKDLFRNTRKLVDSGISILGGAFGEIMSGSVDFAVAFAEIEKKKKIFGLTVSSSVNEQTQALSDEVSRSLYQIIGAMGDAVSSAAEVLGIAEEDIQARLSAFEVQAQKISLKDLGAEEQEEQLNAVFGSIFDGLAASVVPFVREFSQLGEGYAETLIRIATQTQVADELMTQLGNTIMDGLAGQALAQMADDLIKAAGGMDEFISSITGFVNAFATEEHKLKIAGDSINGAFEQMGLALPETRDGVWELMQTLTDPADIARLAQLTDALGIYYDALDDAAKRQAAIDAQRGDLTIQLLRALGDEEQALALERERALEGIHESNRALQLQVWAALDAANAEKKLTDARSSATDRALANLRTAVDAQIQSARGAYERASAAIDAQFDSRIESIRSSLSRRLEWFDNSIKQVSESISSLSQLSGQIASAISANVNATEAMTLARRGAAQGVLQQALDRARSGQPVGDISGALSALSANVSGSFASEFAERLDMAVTANRLAELGQLTDDQLSVEEKTLALLQEQKDSAKANADRQIAALDAQKIAQQERLTALYDAQVANYERMYTAAEDQINALRGIEMFAGDIDDAMAELNDALLNEFSNASVELQTQNNALIQSLIDEVKLLREQSVAYQRAIADYTKKSAVADETRLELERAS